MYSKNYFILVILLLTGCASTNPKEGGFIGGVAGIVSGQYEEDIAKKQAALNEKEFALTSLNETNTKLESDVNALNEVKGTLEEKIAENKRQIDSLTSNIRANNEKINALKRVKKMTYNTKKLKEISKKENELKESITKQETILKKQLELKQKLMKPEN